MNKTEINQNDEREDFIKSLESERNEEQKESVSRKQNKLTPQKKGKKIKRIIFSLIFIGLIIALTYVYHLYDQEKKKEKKVISGDAGVKKEIRDYMENGMGTISMLRKIYPENIVVYDSNKYLFLPVCKNVPKSEIKQDNIKVLENGEVQYVNGDKVVSHKGIDVSKYQGTIDWQKVAADGVEFAIIRVGYRGYGTGAMAQDESFLTNIDGATKAGIKVGVYFFSQAISEKEAEEEADFILNLVKGYKLDYPIVFDTEDVPNEEARTEELSPDELTNITIAFCNRIKKAGYKPVIYAGLRWFSMSLDMSKLNDFEKWYAYYDTNYYFPYKISMWQYSENGSVNGINGKVDMNISFKDWSKE